MIDSIGSPSCTMIEPWSCLEWREQESSSRFASTGRSANRRMLSIHELPTREKAQSWPAPAQTRVSLGLSRPVATG